MSERTYVHMYPCKSLQIFKEHIYLFKSPTDWFVFIEIMLQIIIPSPHCLFFLLAWRPSTKFALVSTKVTRPPPLKGRRNLQTTRASKPTTISLFGIWSEKLLDSLLMKNGPWNCCVFLKTRDAWSSWRKGLDPTSEPRGSVKRWALSCSLCVSMPSKC